MAVCKRLFLLCCSLMMALTAGPAQAGFKTVMATVDREIESDFAPYTPLSVDVSPSLEPQIVSGDFSNVLSFEDVEPLLNERARELLSNNGFVVLPTGDPELTRIEGLYEKLEVQHNRVFVTTDAMLTTYHILFDYSLRVAEMEKFHPVSVALTNAMVEKTRALYEVSTDPYVQGLLVKNLAYFSVPAKLLDPDYEVASEVASLVTDELALIEAHEGRACSPIMGMLEDYSQYVPRGHYTRNETFERYFKAMMWYGRLMFRLEPNSSLSCIEKNEFEETLQALLIVSTIANLETDMGSGLELYDQIYTPTVFYVGEADDLTVQEYLELALPVFGDGFTSMAPDALRDEEKLAVFTAAAKELHDPLINSTFVQDNEDHETTTKGFRFMGQRFIPDSYVFQQLVHRKVWGRMMPRGLDVMAALGSSKAFSILDFVYQDTLYPDYLGRMERLRTWFITLPQESWVQNLYWNWLYCLMPCLVTKGDGFPTFMQNEAWTEKELSTALGSWTELRHDTILYAKQSYSYETGVPDPTKGYVEPNPLVYSRLASLCEMTISGLEKYGLLLEHYRLKFERLRNTLLALKTISEKELVGETLTQSEYDTIYFIGSTLSEIMTFPSDDPSSVNAEDSKMALVADVHTDGNSSRVLEEGIGDPHYIFVIAPTDDGLAACIGGTYSYYEFAWPMNDRLTDGAWQVMLEDGSNPPQPEWMASFVADGVEDEDVSGYRPISIAPNDLIVADGDTLSVSVSMSSSEGLGHVTAYTAVIDPSGNLVFCPGFTSTPQPISLEIPAGTLIKDYVVFQIDIVPWIERGYYTWVAAIVSDESPGTLDSVSLSPLLIR